jgi:hypothetical protein
VDVGEPVVATLELAWDDAKVGLALDLAPADEESLTKAGWRLTIAAVADPASLERAGALLATWLGVGLAGDDATQTEPEEPDAPTEEAP